MAELSTVKMDMETFNALWEKESENGEEMEEGEEEEEPMSKSATPMRRRREVVAIMTGGGWFMDRRAPLASRP